MLNSIWPVFILVSIVYALFSGNIEQVNSSIFECTEVAIKVVITLIGTMSLWSGILKIARDTSLMNKLCNIFSPIINALFPDIKNNKKVKEEISMNIIANFMGLGNAATPMGLKAIKSLEEQNKNKGIMSESMMMLILINASSIQLIPTTVIAIRKSLESENPTSILIPVWCATICAAVAGITFFKLIIKRKNK